MYREFPAANKHMYGFVVEEYPKFSEKVKLLMICNYCLQFGRLCCSLTMFQPNFGYIVVAFCCFLSAFQPGYDSSFHKVIFEKCNQGKAAD